MISATILSALGAIVAIEHRAQRARGKCARRSRGTPRIANRLLRRVRDYAEVKNRRHHQRQKRPMRRFPCSNVDTAGLDVIDRKFLEAILHKFSGGPVGLENVAAAIGESTDTIEDCDRALSDSARLFAARTRTGAWPHKSAICTLVCSRKKNSERPSEKFSDGLMHH